MNTLEAASEERGDIPTPTHEQIAALAHRIYEEEGCPEGRAEAHWNEAERRLRGLSAGVVVAGPQARAVASV